MRISSALALCAVLAAPWTAAAVDVSTEDLMDLSLEELADYKITSVSKQAEPLQGSAAAVYVITREDMARSGYTSIAEALRMVPGVQVARVNAHDWDIGARGFNTGFSNKLLVLIDGRSVYSPLFSGVFWELRNVPVEDVERIEVIRGPGAALWGANAVNGVINIITRPAAEARGLTVRGGGGTEERAFGYARVGGEAPGGGAYRLSASGFQHDGGDRPAGAPDDDWWMTRVQGRADWEVGDSDSVTVTGEVFRGAVDQLRPRASIADPFAAPEPEHGERLGANALGRWQRELSEDSDLTVQLWYEFTDLQFTILRELRHTVDLDVQHHFPIGERHDVIWGVAYRFSHDEERERGTTTLDPRSRGVSLVTGFLQDQIALFPEHLTLTLGSKFEYNEFTGFEIQPSARLAFTPNQEHTLWTAISRAVRTPTRLDDDADLGLFVIPAGSGSEFGDDTLNTLLVLRGNRDFRAEEVWTGEAGYRVRPHEDLTFDFAAFYSDYDDLATAELGDAEPAGGATPFRILPFVLDNHLSGWSWGAEVAGWWQVMPWWRLHASYSYLRLELDTDSGIEDFGGGELQEGQSPAHQAFLRSSFELPRDVQLDAMLRYVDRLPDAGVRSYLELDLHLGWEFRPGWQVGVVGQNLLHRAHRESGARPFATRVERGVYGYLSWRFGGGD